MGSKGPILIVAMGVGALVVFGLIAQFAVEKQPGIQLAASFRKDAVERFFFTGITLRPSSDVCDVRLTVPEGYTPATKDALPVDLADFPRYFREEYPAGLPDKPLQITLVKPAASFGCRPEGDVVLQVQAPPAAALAKVAKELEVHLGPCTVGLVSPTALRVEAKKSVRAGEAQAMLPALLEIDGGGWRTVEFRCGSVRFEFDGNGERVMQ